MRALNSKSDLRPIGTIYTTESPVSVSSTDPYAKEYTWKVKDHVKAGAPWSDSFRWFEDTECINIENLSLV